MSDKYTGLCIGLREGKEVFFRTAADVIEQLQAELEEAKRSVTKWRNRSVLQSIHLPGAHEFQGQAYNALTQIGKYGPPEPRIQEPTGWMAELCKKAVEQAAEIKRLKEALCAIMNDSKNTIEIGQYKRAKQAIKESE